MSVERTIIASTLVRTFKTPQLSWDQADKLAITILNDLYKHDMFVVTLRPETVHTYRRPKEKQ